MLTEFFCQVLKPMMDNLDISHARRIGHRQLEVLCQGARHYSRLDQDPLRAIGILHERNPDKTFMLVKLRLRNSSCLSNHRFRPHNDQATPPTKFSVAITNAFAMEQLIIHGRDMGVALDSSWRNKNENRAPLTFLVTINGQRHCVPGKYNNWLSIHTDYDPGVAFLSEDVQATTLTEFLLATKKRIEEHARGLCNGIKFCCTVQQSLKVLR